jgi:hypothetical protein
MALPLSDLEDKIDTIGINLKNYAAFLKLLEQPYEIFKPIFEGLLEGKFKIGDFETSLKTSNINTIRLGLTSNDVGLPKLSENLFGKDKKDFLSNQIKAKLGLADPIIEAVVKTDSSLDKEIIARYSDVELNEDDIQKIILKDKPEYEFKAESYSGTTGFDRFKEETKLITSLITS